MKSLRILAVLAAGVVFCISADAGAASNSVGINTHLAANDVYDAVSTAGIGWVRIDVNWEGVEPSQGRYNWGEIDRVVNKARSLGLNVFATFAYTPCWASSGNGDGAACTNDVPRAGLYERALAEAVKRYRGKVTHWGLWNEANLGGFWEGNQDQYVDLIVLPGAAAIRANCPECKALGPELANVGDKLNDYYEAALGRAGSSFDIITHHIYQDFGDGVFGDNFFNALESKRLVSSRKALREAMEEYGVQGKEVWITETGYRCEGPTDGDEMKKQADYYKNVLEAQYTRSWWTNTFFYEIYDCGTDIPNCDIDGYGILRRTAGPDSSWSDNFYFKPAYNTLQGWISEHADGEDTGTAGGCCSSKVYL